MLDSREMESLTCEVETGRSRFVLQALPDAKGQLTLRGKVLGQICGEDLSAMLARVQSNPFLSLTMPTFWDMREFDFVGQNTESFRDAIFALQKFPCRKAVKRAYLVNSEIGFGMMRMFQEAANGFRIEDADAFNISYDRGTLLRWLSE